MKLRTLLLLLPAAAFWLLAMEGIHRGSEGPWHDECARLWKDSHWRELQSLADNLWAVGDCDSESLFFAVLASGPLQEHARAQIHAARYLKTRALNWNRETRIRPLFQPPGLRQRIGLYRAHLAYALLILITVLNFGSFLARADLLPWTCFISALGCIILLL